MIRVESDNPRSDYLEALHKCCDAVVLTAYHTRDCAEWTFLT